MRAFLFSDLHVNYKMLDNLKKLLLGGDFDLILFAGDFVNMGEPLGFAEVFIRTLDEINLPFFWVPGNNDFGRAYHRLNSKYPSLEGRVVKFVDVGSEADTKDNNETMKPFNNELLRFTGVGGSPASWAGQYAGENMIDKKLIGGSIFLSHVPPPAILNWQKYDPDSLPQAKKSDHSPAAQNLLGSAHRSLGEGGLSVTPQSKKRFSDAPLVHICGHIHHQWGIAHLGVTKVVKLASLDRGHYAIMDLANLHVQFAKFH